MPISSIWKEWKSIMHDGRVVVLELIVMNINSPCNEEVCVIDYKNLNNWFVTCEPNANSWTATGLHLIGDRVVDRWIPNEQKCDTEEILLHNLSFLAEMSLNLHPRRMMIRYPRSRTRAIFQLCLQVYFPWNTNTVSKGYTILYANPCPIYPPLSPSPTLRPNPHEPNRKFTGIGFALVQPPL